MDQFKLAIAVMAFCDVDGGPRDREGNRRHHSAEALDALVGFSWPWAGMQRRLAAGVNAIRSRIGPQARIRIEPVALPSAKATAQT